MNRLYTYKKSNFSVIIISLTVIIFGAISPFRANHVIRSESIADDLVEDELDDDDPIPEESDALYESDLIITAINPGYKIDDKPDVGELIELMNLSDAPLSLAGFSLRYTNSAGNSTILLNFPDGSLMTGEYLLLSYKNSPNAKLADITYSNSLAMAAGPVELIYDGNVVDVVCWTGKADCGNKAFKSATPTTLVRNLELNQFLHLDTYEAHFNIDSAGLYLPPEPSEDPEEDDSINASVGICHGIEFTEIYSYYANNQSEQFVELYNRTNTTVNLASCRLRYKNKNYSLAGELMPEQYYAYYPGDNFSLTKNPTNSNKLELINMNNEVVDELIYAKGQKKSATYAKFIDYDGSENWAITYNLTPGAENVYQEFRTCAAGKVINPETGNCINATATTTTECPAGKYRNPLTGRCKAIESAAETKPCAEGYERNPTTNRCRKIKSENTGTDYALIPTTSAPTKTSFIAFGVIALIVLAGIVYIILQFRHEITRAGRKARQRLHGFLKHLVARKVGSHRDKDP